MSVFVPELLLFCHVSLCEKEVAPASWNEYRINLMYCNIKTSVLLLIMHTVLICIAGRKMNHTQALSQMHTWTICYKLLTTS